MPFPSTFRLVFTISLARLVARVTPNPDAKRLYDDLIMTDYNKHCRPVREFLDVTDVQVGLSLSQIVNVDELNQILTVNLWVEQEWYDVRFIWDLRQYNNITMLHVPIDKIWRPDIVLYNNADGDYTVTTISKAIISPTGLVTWNPPMQFKSSCEMDVEYFPFDEQICSMKLGPWTHDTTKVDITHKKPPNSVDLGKGVVGRALAMDQYQPGVEWDVMETVAKKNLIIYTCCIYQPYADVTFNITLRRRSLYYIYNLIIPCMTIVMLTCLSFYLPSYSGEKISITISVFLSLSIFQLLLMDLVPSTSLKLPLIGKHIMATLILSTLSILVNTFILCMNYRSTSSHEMSDMTRWIFLRVLPKILHVHNPMVSPKNKEVGISGFKEVIHGPGRYDNRVNRRESLIPFAKLPPFGDTSFIGLGHNKLNLDKFCDACVRRNMAKYQPALQKGLESTCFIAKHYSDEDDSARIQDEWRFVALIIDRILLLVYIGVSGLIALIICLNAPALYDNRTPLTTTLPSGMPQNVSH